MAVAAILAAWCLIAASAWWSPLDGYLIDYVSLKSALAGAIAAASYANLAAGLFAALVSFISVVALLAAIRALNVLYGVRLWSACSRCSRICCSWPWRWPRNG